jgi:hypothetical protein
VTSRLAYKSHSTAIYFDGFLPPSKVPERYKRTIQASKELEMYHASQITGVTTTPSPDSSWSAVELLPERKAATAKDGRTPSPALLVPAIIEALSASSTYGPLTEVVPGEADGYCAYRVQREGGIVITQDSDLLLYDLGMSGGVVWFDDIELKEQFLGLQPQLFALRFTPSRIARRLGLPSHGMLRFGFHTSFEPTASAQRLATMAKSAIPAPGMTDADFDAFAETYRGPPFLADEPQSLANTSNSATASYLDTRISEVVLQCELIHSDPANSPNSIRPVRVFLPLLLDDPTRCSAWESSGRIRELGYYVLQKAIPDRLLAFSEVKRLQRLPKESIGNKVLADPQDLQSFQQLLRSIAAVREGDVLQWVVLAVHQDILWAIEAGKTISSSVSTLQELAAGRIGISSWKYMHLVAQVVATVYSCRMLYQMLEHCSIKLAGEEGDTTHALQITLKGLPRLADFPSCTTLTDIVKKLQDGEALSFLLGQFASNDRVVQQLQEVLHPPRKREKKRLARVAKPATPAATSKLRGSHNMYELLAATEA